MKENINVVTEGTEIGFLSVLVLKNRFEILFVKFFKREKTQKSKMQK